MRNFHLALFVNILLLSGASLSQTAKTPVLVELFTSEGCSSCPPADRLLASLSNSQPIAGAEIIALEEHVDYWDGQGWHDRFSSPVFTTRQDLYRPHLGFDSPYTPQMIIDGDVQFVGNDPSKALAAITKAATKSKLQLELTLPVVDGRAISASISTTSATSLPHGDLFAALVEPTASTQVRAGENSGRHLDHVSVVRQFKRVGSVKDLGKGPLALKLTAPQDTDPAKLRLVVFAQQDNQGSVRAIAVSPAAR